MKKYFIKFSILSYILWGGVNIYAQSNYPSTQTLDSDNDGILDWIDPYNNTLNEATCRYADPEFATNIIPQSYSKFDFSNAILGARSIVPTGNEIEMSIVASYGRAQTLGNWGILEKIGMVVDHTSYDGQTSRMIDPSQVVTKSSSDGRIPPQIIQDSLNNQYFSSSPILPYVFRRGDKFNRETGYRKLVIEFDTYTDETIPKPITKAYTWGINEWGTFISNREVGIPYYNSGNRNYKSYASYKYNIYYSYKNDVARSYKSQREEFSPYKGWHHIKAEYILIGDDTLKIKSYSTPYTNGVLDKTNTIERSYSFTVNLNGDDDWLEKNMEIGIGVDSYFDNVEIYWQRICGEDTDKSCTKTPNTTGTALDTKVGFTTLKRPGTEENDNWPMARKGAWLALESNSEGMVLNRMTTTQINALTPQEGMAVFDTDAKCIKIYDGTSWNCFNKPSCSKK